MINLYLQAFLIRCLDHDWSVRAVKSRICFGVDQFIASIPPLDSLAGIWTFKNWFVSYHSSQFLIERFFLWATNVEEFSKVTYYFLVPLFGFFVCKHHSTVWTFLLSHLLTKADSLPWNSTTIKTKTRIFGWFKFATSPKRGSNFPPLVAQMPVGLLGGRIVKASNWLTLKSVLLTRQRSYKRKFSMWCWSLMRH